MTFRFALLVEGSLYLVATASALDEGDLAAIQHAIATLRLNEETAAE